MDLKSFSILKSLNLLYVEDDLETREELAMMLEPWVGQLHVAADGREGLEKFKTFRPDIVITDIQMPRVSGLVMSGEIRELVPAQPIVIVSAYNDVEYLFRAIELGIDHYVTKPVNVERLLDKLAQMTTAIVAVRERQRNLVLLEQYKQLVDQSAIVCKLDLRGCITYVNDKLCEISAYSSDELIGMDIAELRHASEAAARTEQMLDEARAGHRSVGVFKNRTRRGELYVVESSMVPIVDELGAVAELVLLDVDVSTLYETCENLIESLGRQRVSLDEQKHFLGEYKRALEMGTCICVADRQHCIISVNRQFEQLLGYPSSQLEGQPVSRITSDAICERCLTEAEDFDRDVPSSRVVRFVAENGEELQLSVACIGVRRLTGELESIIMICQDLTESLRLNQDIVRTQRELLYMLGDVVENRSQETGQHVQRVAGVSKLLALKAGLDLDVAEMIETAAPMHDIGKVGIRDLILHKPGVLEPSEFEEMKEHANIGFSILGKVDRPLIGLAAAIAHQHHERYDGSGYPNGLKGEDIRLEARIVSVADVLDALYSSRSYKTAWDESRILDYFREQRGRQFDPRLVDLLLEHWDEVKALRSSSPGS